MKKIVLISLAVILLNSIVFYSMNCSGGPVQSVDVFGAEYIYTSAESIPVAEYYDGYSAYVLGIADSAGELLQFPMYQAEGWLRNNIIKTQKDFYGLEQIVLTPVPEAGYMSLLNYRITDMFALILTIGTIGLLVPSSKYPGKKRVGTTLCAWLLSICIMYLLNVVMMSVFLGLQEFQVAVQSLPAFKSCAYLISCGALLILCYVFKLAGFAVLLCVGLLCFSSRGKMPVVAVVTGFLTAELWFAFSQRPGMPDIFKELNLFSSFGVERFFLRYLNLDMMGQAVSPWILFVAFLVLLEVMVVVVTVRRVSTYTREIREQAERVYYDELDQRYEETRKIRHDINNHLLALNLLIEQGDLDRANKYIGEISEELDRTILPVRTGSNVLDALLCQKLRRARELNIEIQTEIACAVNERGISDYELCGIFGNILDNAMEAVAGLEQPVIRLFIGKQMDMLYISCENPYQGERRKRGEKYLTTKEDMAFHGLGINRIKEIVKAYDGEVSISDNQGNFQIEILLNSK